MFPFRHLSIFFLLFLTLKKKVFLFFCRLFFLPIFLDSPPPLNKIFKSRLCVLFFSHPRLLSCMYVFCTFFLCIPLLAPCRRSFKTLLADTKKEEEAARLAELAVAVREREEIEKERQRKAAEASKASEDSNYEEAEEASATEDAEEEQARHATKIMEQCIEIVLSVRTSVLAVGSFAFFTLHTNN